MRCLILLATFNGEKYLDEQLSSCAAQGFGQVDVLASDDGSSDGTSALLRAWQSKWVQGDFQIISGPKQGFSENFRHLILNSSEGYDYYAFCDQDDVWHVDKLSTAHAKLEVCAGRAGVYCGRTRIIDETGNFEGHSPVMAMPPAFKNALFQSLAGGNTMVLNAEAMTLLRKVSVDCRFVSHDWWAYIWVTGVGGTVVYDPTPKIDYRQHSENLIGKNSGFTARLRRAAMLLTKRYHMWIELNMSSIKQNRDMLAPENQALLEELLASREKSGWRFARELARAQIYRQSRLGTVSLYVGALSGRI
ncbi:MAG: glycosyltransferase [Pseudomonadota bacterium]